MNETYNGQPRGYAYDQTDQLTQDGPRTFAYDSTGNRTLAGYVTGPGNQLLSDSVWNYAYDGEGNVIQQVRIADGAAWTFGYDHNNQLLWVEQRAAGGALLRRLLCCDGT